MIKLLIDAHVFDGKYQGTRTYIQGIYSAMITHKDIEFYFAAQNVSRLRSIFGIAENIHYIRLEATNSIWRLAWEYPRIIKKYKDLEIASCKSIIHNDKSVFNFSF